MMDERSIQTVSTQFDIFKNKGNVEAMLKESLNQFNLIPTPFQQAFRQHFFALSIMLNESDLFKRPQTFGSTKC